jgi:hypothetical protein
LPLIATIADDDSVFTRSSKNAYMPLRGLTTDRELNGAMIAALPPSSPRLSLLNFSEISIYSIITRFFPAAK